jgi:hypothetical protein
MIDSFSGSTSVLLSDGNRHVASILWRIEAREMAV